MNPLAPRLSKQERAVMMGLAESMTPREIQGVMRVSEKTYQEYCRRVRHKFEVRTIHEATLMWVRAEDKTVQRMLKLAAADLIRAVAEMAIEMSGRKVRKSP